MNQGLNWVTFVWTRNGWRKKNIEIVEIHLELSCSRKLISLLSKDLKKKELLDFDGNNIVLSSSFEQN